ncbi:MAG: rhomboid family intramembrane serine protease [Planctomycetota bacterium]
MMSYPGGGYQMRIRFGGPLTPAVKALLIANGAVFAVQIIFHVARPEGLAPGAPTVFENWFAMRPVDAVGRLHLWQFITYSFLHAVTNPLHIAMNMFMLWMFGGDVERALGRPRFLTLYLAAAAVGGICMIPWYFTMLVGASGAVFGVMAAYARLFPERRLLFRGMFPVRARTLVLVLAGINLLAAVAGSDAGVAHFAHLGGFAAGWFFLSFERSAAEFKRARDFRRAGRAEQEDRDVRAEVDRLLTKVGRDGLGSLTGREREFLNRASKRFRK